MHGEPVQVQHVAADAVNAEERWQVPIWLKRHNGTRLHWRRFIFFEQLRQPGDGQAPSQ